MLLNQLEHLTALTIVWINLEYLQESFNMVSSLNSTQGKFSQHLSIAWRFSRHTLSVQRLGYQTVHPSSDHLRLPQPEGKRIVAVTYVRRQSLIAARVRLHAFRALVGSHVMLLSITTQTL